MKGVVLLAIGDPGYGKFAFNMAMTLKVNNPDLPIQLVYEEKTIKHLSDFHLGFFDIKTPIDLKDCYDGLRMVPARAKLKLYDYSVFEENIYLDVDGICIKNIDPIFEMCKNGDYFSQTVGSYTVGSGKEFSSMQWARIEDIVENFKLKEGDIIPAINSSFQFWRKSEKAKELFNQALINLNNPCKRWFKWGKKDYQPDELYMNVALAQLGINPEMKQPQVVYFNSSRIISISDMERDFYFIGLYGGLNFTHLSVREYYDRYVGSRVRSIYKRPQEFKIFNLMRRKISEI